jgi:hypothetical protein
MSKLHEVLAVDGDLAGTAKAILEETVNTFAKKPEHFLGTNKSYLPLLEGEAEMPEERKEYTTTVDDKLTYTFESVIRHYDAFLQKEATNQIAKADLIVDGKTIASNVPATALLGFETKLKELRKVFEAIPTLQPGVAWEADKTVDDRGNVFKRVHPEEKNRTVKQFRSQVLYPATDKHPAQIEKWEEPAVVGRYVTNVWCSMLTPARKSDLLGRVDSLIQAVKQARQRANDVDVLKVNIGDALAKFIMG